MNDVVCFQRIRDIRGESHRWYFPKTFGYHLQGTCPSGCQKLPRVLTKRHDNVTRFIIFESVGNQNLTVPRENRYTHTSSTDSRKRKEPQMEMLEHTFRRMVVLKKIPKHIQNRNLFCQFFLLFVFVILIIFVSHRDSK